MNENDDNGEDAARSVVSDAEETENGPDNQQNREESEDYQDPGQRQPLQVDPNQPPLQNDNSHTPPHGPFPPSHQQMPPFPPPWHPMNGMNHPPPPLPPPPPIPGVAQPAGPQHHSSQHAMAMAFYEQRMRDHAAAYASAAAGAAWVAAQIAAQAAEFAANANANANMGPVVENNSGHPSLYDPSNIPVPPSLPMPMPPAGYYPDHASTNSAAGGSMLPFPPPMMGPPAGEPNGYFAPPGLDQCTGMVWHHNGNDYRLREMPWQQQNNHNNPQFNNDPDQGNEEYEYAAAQNNRRKILRRPPGGISVPQQESAGESNQNSGGNRNSRVRRRLRDHGDSSNSSCATSITSYNSDQAGGNRTYGSNQHQRRQGRGGNPYHRYKKRMKQPRDDTSLLGKTGISALYEWCDKRQLQPSFVQVSPVHGNNLSVEAGEDFEIAVYLEDGVECGRGRGRSKAAAKQDAARKALQALVPGVLFDSETGFLVELPAPNGAPNAAGSYRGNNPGSLEELAPVLAECLSIETSVAQGRERDYDAYEPSGSDRSTPRQAARGADYSSKLKRAWNLYPGTTSTTNSEDDDDNAYYASRGAAVCSYLLSAMVQIDPKIPEVPIYEFEASKVPTNAQMKRKGPASSYGSAIVIRRGPFTCTATLKVHQSPQKPSSDTKRKEDEGAKDEPTNTSSDEFASDPQPKGESEADAQSKDDNDCADNNRQSGDVEEKKLGPLTVLSAVGVGGTKREAKHNASAKLLSLLFPECKTMVEVKAAAEAAREAYAASKALKQQQSQMLGSRRRGNRSCSEGKSKVPRLSLSSSGIFHLNATAADKDPPLPSPFATELFNLLRSQDSKKRPACSSHVDSFEKLNLNQDSDAASSQINSADNAEDESTDDTNPRKSSIDQEAICRQHSRRIQLEKEIEKALLVCNEEEERELTVEVGRTVLRRAEPDDIDRVRKLLSCRDARRKMPGTICPASILGDAPLVEDGDSSDGKYRRPGTGDDQDDEALRLWGSSTIVLLLCRAIAAFEDPPLGCAVLTLGFSMQKGRLLRIAQIGSESHLPRERFLDCLDAFATCMQCTLEREEPKPCPGVILNSEQCKTIIQSHLQSRDKEIRESRLPERNRNANVSAPLQSVLEESEGGDDSDRPAKEAKSGKPKVQDKPCKRSRVN